MKICVLFEGDIYHLRGEFMAIHNRLKYMLKDPLLNVEIFLFQRCYDNLANHIKGQTQIDKKQDLFLDDIHYHCLYYKRSYLDFFFRSVCKYQTSIEAERVRHYKYLFKGFDLIYAHSLYTGLLALDLKKEEGIPFVIMWHGSSIHTHPFTNKSIFKLTQKVLQNANHNFFVSQDLYNIARKIAKVNIIGSVSPNGIDTNKYRRYSDVQKIEVANRLNIDLNKYNIAFVGNYLPVKNVQYLPELFGSIYKDFKNVYFHIIGNGAFDHDFQDLELPIRYWGNQMPEVMIDIYNCMNLVVLPSKNEGLPMTCLEAISCGTSFVGSRVGGIADIIGVENTVPLSSSFETDFALLCKNKVAIGGSHSVALTERYDIRNVVSSEVKVISEILASS